jgi:probable rRNA maturation factor
MSGALTLRNRKRARAVDLRRLDRLARHLLAEQFQVRHFALGVYLIGARAMTRLNERFLRHGGSTDVITFDYGEPGRPEALCGDIFICLDEAALAARRFRTTWQAELVRYLVHGLLHLRGYDDQAQPDYRRMKREENRLVKRLAKTFCFRALGPGRAGLRKRPRA